MASLQIPVGLAVAGLLTPRHTGIVLGTTLAPFAPGKPMNLLRTDGHL